MLHSLHYTMTELGLQKGFLLPYFDNFPFCPQNTLIRDPPSSVVGTVKTVVHEKGYGTYLFGDLHHPFHH